MSRDFDLTIAGRLVGLKGCEISYEPEHRERAYGDYGPLMVVSGGGWVLEDFSSAAFEDGSDATEWVNQNFDDVADAVHEAMESEALDY